MKKTSTQIDSQKDLSFLVVFVHVSVFFFFCPTVFSSGSLICKQTVKRVWQPKGKINLHHQYHHHHHHHGCRHESRTAVLSNSQCVLPVRLSVYCWQTEAPGSQTYLIHHGTIGTWSDLIGYRTVVLFFAPFRLEHDWLGRLSEPIMMFLTIRIYRIK